MVHITQSTKSVSSKAINHEWHLIDVDGKVLGRVAQEIATFLQGKHKVTYTPNLDNGDIVIVINAKKVKVTGRKADTKLYTNYSGYPDGLRTRTFSEVLKSKPEEVIRRAVSGMLPKNKLRDPRLARLHIFAGDIHPYGNKIK